MEIAKVYVISLPICNSISIGNPPIESVIKSLSSVYPFIPSHVSFCTMKINIYLAIIAIGAVIIFLH